jgi:hypothetical protein
LSGSKLSLNFAHRFKRIKWIVEESKIDFFLLTTVLAQLSLSYQKRPSLSLPVCVCVFSFPNFIYFLFLTIRLRDNVLVSTNSEVVKHTHTVKRIHLLWIIQLLFIWASRMGMAQWLSRLASCHGMSCGGWSGSWGDAMQ